MGFSHFLHRHYQTNYQTNPPIGLIIFAIISQNPVCNSFIFRIRSNNTIPLSAVSKVKTFLSFCLGESVSGNLSLIHISEPTSP